LRESRESIHVAEREAARLTAVRRLSEAPPEGLEQHCRIAAALFGADAAGLTLAGSAEVRTIAGCGFEPASVPRSDSLCSCVILQPEPYVIRDAQSELAGLERAAGRPGLIPRFYAAVPLTTANGLRVGTLFAADQNPRDASIEQLKALEELGRLAMRTWEAPRELAVRSGDDELSTPANELLRVLSGGAAHDFSELITGWIGCVDALEKELLAGSEAHDLAGQLKRTLVPAARLNDHFKAFTEGIGEITDALPLNQLVESSMKMLRHSVRPGVRLAFRPDGALEGMRIDTRDFELVLAALVLHADACIGEGETLEVSSGWEQFEEPRATRFITLGPGLYACVAVEYTGSAPSPEARAELFDQAKSGPITSLSLAARVVARAGGALDLRAGPDGQVAFRAYMPVIWRPRSVDARADEDGKIHILLVENHEVVLRGVKSALVRRGFRVSTAENGAEALQKFPQGTGFDMLVTDVVMDPVDGVALAEKMREQRPELSVVFLSGYDKVGVDPRCLPERTRFLAKPFTADALVQQVASLLPDRTTEA
jgi:CheY-like chemotaxis protein